VGVFITWDPHHRVAINTQLFVLEIFCCYWSGPVEDLSGLFDLLSKYQVKPHCWL